MLTVAYVEPPRPSPSIGFTVNPLPAQPRIRTARCLRSGAHRDRRIYKRACPSCDSVFRSESRPRLSYSPTRRSKLHRIPKRRFRRIRLESCSPNTDPVKQRFIASWKLSSFLRLATYGKFFESDASHTANYLVSSYSNVRSMSALCCNIQRVYMFLRVL